MVAMGTWRAALPRQRILPPPPVAVLVMPSWAKPLAADLWNVPRYCLKYGTFVLALLGLTLVWHASGDGPVPTCRILTSVSGLDPLRVSAPGCMLPGTARETRRAALGPALEILDQVHPEAEGWVRDTDRQGKLVFVDQLRLGRGGDNLAEYDAVGRTLRVGRGVFAEDDGNIAVVLCHEYRHARQSLAKTIVYALSFVIRPDGQPAIIENDAALFEQEARLAVFGSCQPP